MSIINFFRSRKKQSSASVAKERLQIIVAHERGLKEKEEPDYLPQLQKELMEVIRKYVNIDNDQVQVALDNQDDCSILELNITLPDR